METDVNQYEACRRLMSSVVTLAIKDACARPVGAALNTHAGSGLEFLFYHSDGYLRLLDADPERFRKLLLDYIDPKHKDTKITDPKLPHNLSEIDRRNFRINYGKWVKQRGAFEFFEFEGEEDE